MLAKFVNDNAALLVVSGVFGFFASKLAPTQKSNMERARFHENRAFFSLYLISASYNADTAHPRVWQTMPW